MARLSVPADSSVVTSVATAAHADERELREFARANTPCGGAASHAFVVLKQGARSDERELLEFARANLAHFKAPHSVTFVTGLPKTPTGKIQEYILRTQRPAMAPQ